MGQGKKGLAPTRQGRRPQTDSPGVTTGQPGLLPNLVDAKLLRPIAACQKGKQPYLVRGMG